MGDDDARCLRCLQFVYTLCHNTHGIYVKTRVGLVEDAQFGLQHSHLENLVALLLTTAETLVNRAVSQLRVELNNLTFLALQLQEFGSVHGLQSLILALLVDGSLHKVGHRYTWNLNGILERKEQPLVGTVLRLHLQQVLTVEESLALGHLVKWVTHQYGAQGRFS